MRSHLKGSFTKNVFLGSVIEIKKTRSRDEF